MLVDQVALRVSYGRVAPPLGDLRPAGSHNSSLTFAPKLQPPFNLPVLLVGVLGSVKAEAPTQRSGGTRFTLELTIGELQVDLLVVGSSVHPGAIALSASGKRSISWELA